jgi:hypothetical protein
MNWAECSNCGTVQLEALPSLELIYREAHNEGIGKVWSEHEARFSNFVSRHAIGRVHRIEPAALNSRELAVPDFSRRLNGTLVHSHTMEHWRSPRDVLGALARNMVIGSRMIFSIPAMNSLLRAGILATLNFEHSFLLSNPVVARLLNQAGFAMRAVEHYDGHSNFFACERVEPHSKNRTESDLTEGRLVKRILTKNQRDVLGISEAIGQFEGPVYLFGAHIFSQYLLKLGLREEVLAGVLDNSRAKEGKRLYGSRLLVSHPSQLQTEAPTMFIVRTGVYDGEIKRGLREQFGGNAIFC